MRTFVALQKCAVDWHERRFPGATIGHVGLKLGEEVGEVHSALLAEFGFQSATGDGDVVSELADVIINVMVIAGRWYPNESVLERVDQKLRVLLDPNSGHRAALRG
jgi:hypothetical protein